MRERLSIPLSFSTMLYLCFILNNISRARNNKILPNVRGFVLGIYIDVYPEFGLEPHWNDDGTSRKNRGAFLPPQNINRLPLDTVYTLSF